MPTPAPDIQETEKRVTLLTRCVSGDISYMLSTAANIANDADWEVCQDIAEYDPNTGMSATMPTAKPAEQHQTTSLQKPSALRIDVSEVLPLYIEDWWQEEEDALPTQPEENAAQLAAAVSIANACHPPQIPIPPEATLREECAQSLRERVSGAAGMIRFAQASVRQMQSLLLETAANAVGVPPPEALENETMELKQNQLREHTGKICEKAAADAMLELRSASKLLLQIQHPNVDRDDAAGANGSTSDKASDKSR